MIQYMADFYIFSFAFLFFGLILWVFLRHKNKSTDFLQKIYIAAGILYLLSVVFGGHTTLMKLWVVIRDLLVLTVTFFICLATRKNKLVYGIATALFIVFFSTFYLKVITSTVKEISDNVSKQGEILLDLGDDDQITELNKIFNEYDISYKKAFPNLLYKGVSDLEDYWVLDVSDEHEYELVDIIDELREDTENVDWVEENNVLHAIRPLESATSPEAKQNYIVNDPFIKELWGFDLMEVGDLFNYLNDPSVKPVNKSLIAILDTGIDAEHEDLKSNYKSFNRKYDIDKQGHGTHCAGIASAVSNNNIGIASFNFDNKFTAITSVKVLDDMGRGTDESIISGIIEAVDGQADVISLSLGGRSTDDKQKAFTEAIKYATASDCIVVVAAGNESSNANDYTPANIEGVITVTAVNSDNELASFSNHVEDIKMGVAAPGVSIYSTIPGNQYKANSGTSMATPYVAGLIGILKSLKPSLTTKDIYKILDYKGMDTNDTDKTGKLIHPIRAVKSIM